MSESSAALLERARAGDRRALDELVVRHQASVYRFSMKMCRDPEDAKDVLQDTFLAMARGIRDFRGASSISTWLYTIARSFCIKKRRTQRRVPDGGEPAVDGDAGPFGERAKRPDEVLVEREVERALADAIASLEPKYREVLVLRDVEGLTASEVAEILGVGVPAVKSRLHRARISVRARIAPLLGVEGAANAEPAADACPDVLRLFSKHLEGDIGAAVCARMEEHVERCPRCRGACDSLKRTLALCRASADEVDVPADVQQSVRDALRRFLDRDPRPT